MVPTELLVFQLPVEQLALGLAAILGGFLAGSLVGRSGRGRLFEDRDRLSTELERTAAQAKEHGRQLQRSRGELQVLNHLLLNLPKVISELNRSDLDPSLVPDLVLRLANVVFQPKHVLLYQVRMVQGQYSTERILELVSHTGFSKVPEPIRTIRFGEGKIGWVADHEQEMAIEDWDTLSRTECLNVPDQHAEVSTELIGPLLHHSVEGAQLLGVIAIGAPSVQTPNPKLTMQMVTNLGTLALVSSKNMSQLRTLAHHDGLTRLFNKRYFAGELAPKALIECEKNAKELALLIFDIDHFKNYNDTNGHPAGDELLRGISRLIREHIGDTEYACRYGGEEFLIVMPGVEEGQAFQRAEELREKIATEEFQFRENQPLGHMSISGGIAMYPKDGDSIDQLIQHADEALYRCKKGGRNRIAIYRGVELGEEVAVDQPASIPEE